MAPWTIGYRITGFSVLKNENYESVEAEKEAFTSVFTKKNLNQVGALWDKSSKELSQIDGYRDAQIDRIECAFNSCEQSF